MKQLRRLIFNTFTFMLLLSFLGTLVLFAMSFLREQEWGIEWGGGMWAKRLSYSVTSAGGGIKLDWTKGYELRDEYFFTGAKANSTTNPTFAVASTGRLIEATERECYYSSAKAPHDWSAVWRFKATKIDEIDGNLLGSTHWMISYKLEFPHWALAAGLGLLPCIRLLRYRNRRSLALAGHCGTCGYDLRATPDRCPECGSVPKRIA